MRKEAKQSATMHLPSGLGRLGLKFAACVLSHAFRIRAPHGFGHLHADDSCCKVSVKADSKQETLSCFCLEQTFDVNFEHLLHVLAW